MKNHFSTKRNDYQKLYNVPLTKVYPGYSQKEIDRLVNETWIRGGLEFEPFTQFKERAYKSKYVNVSPDGYRLTVPQGPWPPDPNAFNIFLFGGSTTFNYGVADYETTATYLQQDVQAAFPNKHIWVYNFGRGFYYSSQELILFERLLLKQYRPDMAIFIDGLNDFGVGYEDKPGNTDELHRYIDSVNRDTAPSVALSSLVEQIPLVRFAEYLKTFGKKPIYRAPKAQTKGEEENTYGNQDVLTGVITRYFENKKMIESLAASYAITSVFVIQPVPFYEYDLKYHIFYNGSDPHLGMNRPCDNLCYVKYGYPLLASYLKKQDSEKNLIWLADMQEKEHKALYVDSVHYTAYLSKMVAQKISSLSHERGFLSNERLLY